MENQENTRNSTIRMQNSTNFISNRSDVWTFSIIECIYKAC